MVKQPPLVETEEVKQLLLALVETVLTSSPKAVQIMLWQETATMIGRIGWQKTAKRPAIFVMEVLVSWDDHIQAFCIIRPSLIISQHKQQ